MLPALRDSVGRGANTIMKSEIERRRRHRRAVNTLGPLVFITLGPLTLGLLLAAYSPPAHADTVTVFGTPGVDGAPGSNGGPGGDATATTPPNSDPSNTANATGGAGGTVGPPSQPPRALLLLTEELAATPPRLPPRAQPALAMAPLPRLPQAAQAAQAAFPLARAALRLRMQ
jgi:hypothetical protein